METAALKLGVEVVNISSKRINIEGMKKLLMTLVLVLLLVPLLPAQDFAFDALYISKDNYYGTARVQAIGGANTALGADMSSIIANPAGLGLLSVSEFSFTPSLNFDNAKSSYYGDEVSDFKLRFNFNQIGLSYAHRNRDIVEESKGGITFAVALTRTGNYNNSFVYEGNNTQTSIADFFADEAQGKEVLDLTGFGKEAFDLYLIELSDPKNDRTTYRPINRLGVPFQREAVNRSGSQYTISGALGTSFDDKFFVGVGANIIRTHARSLREFRENMSSADEQPGYVYDETISEVTTGWGGNLSLGMIYQPLSFVRFGVSLTTLSFHSLRKKSHNDVFVNYNGFEYYDVGNDDSLTLNSFESKSALFVTNYEFIEPLKLNGGVALFLGKFGFITADIERINYADINLSSRDQSVKESNTFSKNFFKNVYNVKVGGEISYDAFRFRVGYAFFQSPVKKSYSGVNQDVTQYTAGIGIRRGNYYLDAAYVNTFGSEIYNPYQTSQGDSPVVKVSRSKNSLIFTAGFYF